MANSPDLASPNNLGSPRTSLSQLAALWLLTLAACGDSGAEAPLELYDASIQSVDAAALDSGALSDAQLDSAAQDAESALDAALDGGLDGALDAGSDAGLLDAATDAAGGDAGKDASTADASVSSDGLTVQVSGGAVHGQLAGQTRKFLGIPYATPPLGSRRFLAPEPVKPWQGTREASQFGPSCMQPKGGVTGAMSEDCLTLNVFAPRQTPTQPLPVMVFIHGGAFLAGGSSSYDAQRLREAGDVLVVTLNYRVGALGFLTHSALDALDTPYTNQGLRDQQLALSWVHDNIQRFGGDPDNVTLFGESAGSVSTCAHLFAKGSESLAQRFIMESGSCVRGGLAIQPRAYAVATGKDLVDGFCPQSQDVLTCLRNLSAEYLAEYTLADLDPVVDGFWPFVDGSLFAEAPELLLSQGKLNHGAMIAGTNRNEWLLWHELGVTSVIPNLSTLNTEIERLFPQHSQAIKEQYVPARNADADAAFVRLMTDFYFRCPTRALVRGATAQSSKAYLYSFEVTPGAHAQETDYVFDQLAVSWLFVLDAPIPLLGSVVQATQGYWTNFARAGNPNKNGLTSWPVYTEAADRHLVLDEPLSVASGLAKNDCDFWDALWAAN